MFEKLFGKKPPTQSMSVSGVNATGGQVQIGQAGRDLTQNQEGQMATQQQGLTGAEVLALLDRLKGAIESTDLTADQKEKMLSYLKTARLEADSQEPDKDMVGKCIGLFTTSCSTTLQRTWMGHEEKGGGMKREYCHASYLRSVSSRTVG